MYSHDDRLPADPVVISGKIEERGSLTGGAATVREYLAILGSSLVAPLPAFNGDENNRDAEAVAEHIVRAIRDAFKANAKTQVYVHAYGAASLAANIAFSSFGPAELQQVNFRAYGAASFLSRPYLFKSNISFFHTSDISAALADAEVLFKSNPNLAAFFNTARSRAGVDPLALANASLAYLFYHDKAVLAKLAGVQFRETAEKNSHSMAAYIDTAYPR